jgi:hypothetical protein
MLVEAMTLMDAKQYDSGRDRRRRIWVAVAIVLFLIAAWFLYHARDYPQRKVVGKFFAALQNKDYEGAYAVWFQDPAWREHPQKYSQYPFNDFYRDWGPGGEWGLIQSFKIDCSLPSNGGSGVIVQATVNSRLEHAYVWADKGNKTLSFSPNEIQCGNWWGWVTE